PSHCDCPLKSPAIVTLLRRLRSVTWLAEQVVSANFQSKGNDWNSNCQRDDESLIISAVSSVVSVSRGSGPVCSNFFVYAAVSESVYHYALSCVEPPSK